jgi:hypothetical protein
MNASLSWSRVMAHVNSAFVSAPADVSFANRGSATWNNLSLGIKLHLLPALHHAADQRLLRRKWSVLSEAMSETGEVASNYGDSMRPAERRIINFANADSSFRPLIEETCAHHRAIATHRPSPSGRAAECP